MDLVRVLYAAGIEYTHGERYCVLDHCNAHRIEDGRAEVAGYDSHGQVPLTDEQEDLLREILEWDR
jgi:hypothetical protein